MTHCISISDWVDRGWKINWVVHVLFSVFWWVLKVSGVVENEKQLRKWTVSVAFETHSSFFIRLFATFSNNDSFFLSFSWRPFLIGFQLFVALQISSVYSCCMCIHVILYCKWHVRWLRFAFVFPVGHKQSITFFCLTGFVCVWVDSLVVLPHLSQLSKPFLYTPPLLPLLKSIVFLTATCKGWCHPSLKKNLNSCYLITPVAHCTCVVWIGDGSITWNRGILHLYYCVVCVSLSLSLPLSLTYYPFHLCVSLFFSSSLPLVP